MLEQLFGSKTRVRLLRLLLNHPGRPFFVRELSRRVGAQINAVRNEIDNLSKLGLLLASEGAPPEGEEFEEERPKGRRAAGQRKYYRVNTDSVIYPELRDLFAKSQVLVERDFVQKLAAAGNISYLALAGFFVGEKDAPTDVFVVGRVAREKIVTVIRAFEREVGREINFTIMTPQDYKYRREVTDRFLYSLLEARKIVVLDTLSEHPPV
jgi:DNA-binding transcriptional ArsR family regulator